MMKTKIIATIGPASDKLPVLKKMAKAGMDIARINTKYGSVTEYEKTAARLKKVRKCKVLFDIKDMKSIRWLKGQDFDYLAVSFAEIAMQIRRIRKIFLPRKIRIISKIETKKGIEKMNEKQKLNYLLMLLEGQLDSEKDALANISNASAII